MAIEINLNDIQERLISNSNIKTINGQTLLGPGNIAISGSTGGGERSVDTASDIGLISDLNYNEDVYIKDRNVKFRVTDKSLDNVVRLEQTPHVGFSSNSYPTTNNYFKTGDKFTFDFNIKDIGIGTGNVLYFLNIGNPNTFSINLSYVSNQISIIGMNVSIILKNADGVEVPRTGLSLDVWYRVEATVINNFTLLSSGLRMNVDTYGKTGWAANITRLSIQTASAGLDIYTINEVTKQFENQTGQRKFVQATTNVPMIVPIELRLDQIIDGNSTILEPVLTNGIITPQILGYNEKLNQDLNFLNDAKPYLQFCMDSPYVVHIPGGNYYMSDLPPVKIRDGKTVNMEGNYKFLIGNNTETTTFYSDKNITFFRVEGQDIQINNGVVSFEAIEDLGNPTAFEIGGNEKVLTTKSIFFDKVSVYNDYFRLQQKEGIGGYAIKFNTDFETKEVVGSYSINGVYAYGIDFTGLNIAVYSPKFSTTFIADDGWGNTCEFQGRITNCKQGIVAERGGFNIFEILIKGQDNPILTKAERELYYYILDAPYIKYDIFTYDMTRRTTDPENNYRHTRHIYSVHPTNIAAGKSFIGWSNQNTKVYNTNKDNPVMDPSYLGISANPKNATQISNQLSHAGLDDGFSYKGYVEPLPIEVFPQNNAASEAGTNSIGTFVAVLNNPGITVETSNPYKTSNYVRISSVDEENSSAKIDIACETDKAYSIQLDLRGSSAKYRLRIEGIVDGIDELYSSNDWKTRVFEVVATTTTMSIFLEPIVGITSSFTDTGNILWKDVFIRGENYRLEFSDGSRTESILYTPSNSSNIEEDHNDLTAIFSAQGLAITVDRAGYRRMIFRLNNEFDGAPVEVKTILLGSSGDYVDIDGVTIKEYWHKNNLFAADSYLNPLTLTEATTSDIVITNDGLLTKINSSSRNYHNVKTAQAFAEIVVPVQDYNAKIRRVLASTGLQLPNEIQISLVNLVSNEVYGTYKVGYELAKDSLIDILPKWWESRNDIVTHVIFRYLGAKELNKNIEVIDLMATTQDNNYQPFLSKAGGRVSTKGNLIVESPIADEAKYDQLDVMYQFGDTDITDFPIINYKTTILLINTSGSVKNFLFQVNDISLGYGANAGKRYMIFCGKKTAPFNYPNAVPDSGDIAISNTDPKGIATLDGQPLLMKAGDWIEVMLIKNGGNNTQHKLIELRRSDIASYSFITP